MYMVTDPNIGFPTNIFVYDGVAYPQEIDILYQKLRDAGITTVEVAGEFRGLCAAQVAQ